MAKHFDMSKVTVCLDKHKPKIDDLRKLEQSTSMDNLPDSRELKCYLNCILVELGFIKAGNVELDRAKVSQSLKLFTKEEQMKFGKMIKGCKPTLKDNDVCDYIYQFHLCMKKNSPEDFYILWRTDLEPDA